ncbi:MAG: transposase [Isosphaeraceae bacterium]
MKTARRLRQLQRPQSLLDHVREFLTPSVWKQARQAVPRRRALPRWDLQPLVLVMIAMTWAAGDSQFEKFETARGFHVACYVARKRPGKTLEGLRKALGRVPMRSFRALAAGVRQQIRARYAARLIVDGFEPMGCDGSRVECPRAVELETRLGQAGKPDAAPTVWITAFVHLGLGVLWSWRVGPGTAAEQEHLRHLLGTLSTQALIVCDAAYMGYGLVQAIVGSKRSFLFRMSSKVHLYTSERVTLQGWTEGPVLYWPKYVQDKGKPPIACRLIRVSAKGRVKHDAWLLTDVLDPARLSAATAAKFYRWRWRNEGVFRIFKRTINKMKLSSRTVRLVHREAELSLLATQVLLAHADLALRSKAEAATGEAVVSPRKVLIEIRCEMKGTAKRRMASYRERLRTCRSDDREETSPKAARAWPRRKPHESPRPPILHTLNEDQKLLLHKQIAAAG